MPKEGMRRREYRAAKFGSWERSLAADAQLTEVGRAEGIRFAFEKIGRTPNTLDAHRLILMADAEGVQEAVVEALFRAYFTEGRDLSHTTTLLDVVGGAGLDRSRAEGLLRGDGGWPRSARPKSKRAVWGYRACRSSLSTARSRCRARGRCRPSSKPSNGLGLGRRRRRAAAPVRSGWEVSRHAEGKRHQAVRRRGFNSLLPG
jgi:hypothetical protein